MFGIKRKRSYVWSDLTSYGEELVYVGPARWRPATAMQDVQKWMDEMCLTADQVSVAVMSTDEFAFSINEMTGERTVYYAFDRHLESHGEGDVRLSGRYDSTTFTCAICNKTYTIKEAFDEAFGDTAAQAAA